MHALNFWEVIAREEGERAGNEVASHGFVAANAAPLVSMVLGVMCSPTANLADSEPDDFGPVDQAHNCFVEVCCAVGAKRMLELVVPWAQAAMPSPEWQKREAAAMALGLLQERCTLEEVGAIDAAALPILWARLLAPEAAAREDHPKVREALAYFIAQAYLAHSVALLDTAEKVKGAVGSLCRLLQDKTPEVARLAAVGLNYVFSESKAAFDAGEATALYVKTPSGDIATLFSGAGGSLEILHGVVGRGSAAAAEEESALSQECFKAVNVIISTFCLADVNTAEALLREVGMARLSASVARTAGPPATAPLNAAERAVEREVQTAFCGMVHEVLLKAQDYAREDPPENAFLDKLRPLAEPLCALLLSVVDRNLVFSDAWLSLGNMLDSELLPEAFWLQPAVLSALHPRIMAGLQSVAEGDTERVNACLLAAGDVLRKLRDHTPPELVLAYANAVLGILGNVHLDRSLKPVALELFVELNTAFDTMRPMLDPCLMYIGDAAQVPDAVRRAPRSPRARRWPSQPRRTPPRRLIC